MKTILKGTIAPKTITYLAPDVDAGGGGGDAEAAAAAEAVKEEKPKNLSEFNQRFTAKNRAPTLVGELPNQEQVDDAKKRAEAAEEKPDEHTEEERRQLRQEREQKRPGSNVPKILEEKRNAEKERDEYKTKLGEFESKLKPELEGKIADLQKKIDSGELSSAKETEYTNKITALEQRIQTEQEAIVNENKRLKGRVALYDLSEDDDFKANYLNPVVESYGLMAEAIGDDTKLDDAVQRALMHNQAALAAKSKEQRLQHERARDEIFTDIAEKLPGFTGNQFTTAASQYILAAKKHAVALSKHEETAKEIQGKRQQARTEALSKTLRTWGATYDTMEPALKEHATLSKEEAEKAKELGLKYEEELKDSSTKAKNAVIGEATMQDSITLIHRGRVFPTLNARISVLRAQLADRDALIKKLRGAGPSGGNDSKNNAGNGGVKKEPTTREKWQSKFSANRNGLVKKEGAQD